MQAAVFVGRVRFVARIDDGAVECGLQSDARVDVVGALAELISRLFVPLPYSHAARSRPNLTRDKMRGHQGGHVVERHGAAHHVVFVRAPTGAFTVHIIAMQHDMPACDAAGGLCGGEHETVARIIECHGLERIVSFRRGILGVRVVHIDAPAIGGYDVGDVELG